MPAMAKLKKAVKAVKKAVKAVVKKVASVKKPAAKPAKKKPAAKPASAKKKPAAKPASAKKKPAAKVAKPTKKPSTTRPSARARGVTVDDYAAKQGGWQKHVIAELREILREGAPGATEQIKWGQPVYDWNGPFAHIKAFSSSVNLGFWRGATLNDPQGLLSGDGDRMKYVKITAPKAVQHGAFVALVREAVRLNDELGDPTKR
jgi:hypothetical protein